MTSYPREFVCVDCKAHVFCYGGPANAERCANCTFIRALELPPAEEAEFRRVLDCQLAPADDP